MNCEIKEYTESCEECSFCKITKNKNIELPCFVGDKVYHIQYQTNARVYADNTPKIIEMTVEEIMYIANQKVEKYLIDVSFINNLGDKSIKRFNWDDGLLFDNERDALNKIG